MTRRTFALLCALLPSLWAAPARADDAPKAEPTRRPFLWVVEGNPRIYLFGTLHVPDDRVVAFPDAVRAAIASSDCVLTEVPGGASGGPGARAAMLLPEGKTLSDVCPRDVVERLRAFLQSRGTEAAAYDRLRPWAVALTLQSLDVPPELAGKKPPAEAIPDEAEKAGKECAALGTPDEPYAPYAKLSDAQQAKLLSATIDQLESAKKAGRDPVQELVEAYLAGDEGKLLSYVQEASVTGDEDLKALRTRMIAERNARLVDRLLEEAKKRPGKTILVAVGAEHFAGDAGLPALLQKKGMKVVRLTAGGGAAAPGAAPATPTQPKATPPAPPPQPAPPTPPPQPQPR